MRRLFAAAVLCAAFLLLATAAAAAPAELPARGHGLADHAAQAGAARSDFAPLGARLAAISLTVHVLQFNGTPAVGVKVMWMVNTTTDSYGSDGETNDFGDVTFTDAVAATGNGQLYVWIPRSSSVTDTSGWGKLSWSAGQTLTVRPGRVAAGVVRGGPWDDFTFYTVSLVGDTRYSYGDIDASDGSEVASGDIDAADGSYDRGAVYYWNDEGSEFSDSFSVTSGVRGHTAPTQHQASAQRITVSKPYWASGAPGTVVQLALGNFPAGWKNEVYGVSEYPLDSDDHSYGILTAGGSATSYVNLKVPASATPGYWYNIGVEHINGLQMLALSTPFQVCTMKPSRAKVARGAKVRVKGIVPVYKHWGAEPGEPKPVTLYAHRGKAPVPTKWNPKSQGWVKVGSVKTNAYGAYSFTAKVYKTLTFVVRYPGDDWWYEAYTSAKTVKVR
jgi:hypothetical protein